MRPSLEKPSPFPRHAIDKVERLLELLDEVSGHGYLSERVVLHGGTALIVFHMDLPRISVDADLLYVGSPDRDVMLEERGAVDEALGRIAVPLGYEVVRGADEHAGRTYVLTYETGYGRDRIKVDMNYLSRVPLLDTAMEGSRGFRPTVSIRTLSLPELCAGKFKALFERAALRDLYDVYLLGLKAHALGLEGPAFRRLAVFYVSVSDAFPCALDGKGVTERFAGREGVLDGELYPFLHVDDRPGLDEMRAGAAGFLDRTFQDLDRDEREYLELLADKGEFRPELLFDPASAELDRARRSPAAEWKVRNLLQRQA